MKIRPLIDLRLSTWLVVVTALILTVGCGEGLPPPAEADRARQALSEVLEDWKGGKPQDASGERGGPPRLLDPDRDQGAQLVDYRLEGDFQRLGHNLQCKAELTLKSPQGKLTQKSVIYQVGGGDPMVISRQDLDF